MVQVYIHGCMYMSYIKILYLNYNQASRVVCKIKYNEHWVKYKQWKDVSL